MTRPDMSTRLLRLLSLLQSRPEWPGGELAAKLGVTTRTVRRDIDRLRQLDYVVESVTGTAGGYRLGSGQKLPLLHLDDDEAVAVVAGLVTGAGGGIVDIEDSSVRALAKLNRLLPARLRPRLSSITQATTAASARPAPPVSAAVLATLAWCCTEQEIVTFGYRNRSGEASERRVEPHNLITVERLWYLLGFDVNRDGWRLFRIDRIDDPTSTRHRFARRDLPAENPADYLARSLATAQYRYTATLTVPLPAESVRASLFAPVPGDITSDGASSCTIRLSAESAEVVTQYIVAVGALTTEFTVETSTEIRARLRTLGRKLSAV